MVLSASGVLRNPDCTGANAHNSMEPPQWLFLRTHRLLRLTVRRQTERHTAICAEADALQIPRGRRQNARAPLRWHMPKGHDLTCLETPVMRLSSFGLATN